MSDLFGAQPTATETTAERVRRLEARETPMAAVSDLLAHRPWPMDYGRIWEPCAGTGVLADQLSERGFRVVTSDIHPWAGYDFDGDLFAITRAPAKVVWTNPPFSRAHEIVRHLLAIGVDEVILFHSWSWFTQKRAWWLFDDIPPTHVAPLARRVTCWEFHLTAAERRGSTPDRFAWYRFLRGFAGAPTIARIPEPAGGAS